MRILLVNYEYPPLGGGGGELTRTLVRSLARDHDVVVLTSRDDSLPKDAEEDGARILRASVPRRAGEVTASTTSLAAFPVSAVARARALLRSWRPDVVHTFFAIPTGPAGAVAARLARAPHVLTVIGADVYDPTRRFSPHRFPPLGVAVRSLVRNATAVTAISRDIAARARHLTRRSDIEVVWCSTSETPLPQPDRRALGWKHDEIVIVSTARLVPRKGLDLLIRGAQDVDAPMRLEIVGDGPDRSRLEALAQRSRHPVVFTGAIPSAERDLRLVSADAFALPSLHEGFGIAVLEAMRAGLPVIAGASGGPPDFVDDGASGCLVPADPRVIARALDRLVGDAGLRRTMGDAARAAAEGFSTAVMTERYLGVYRAALRS